jgi:hypothetical protein
VQIIQEVQVTVADAMLGDDWVETHVEGKERGKHQTQQQN